jgi:DDE superfamily endonuclease
MVCANLATHKAPVIRDWLARHPRFRLHFTPTGSSRINQVERWFGFLTDQTVRRGVHKSVQALEADIRAWIENWNRNPPALHLDHDHRRDPRLTGKVFSANFRRGILGQIWQGWQELLNDIGREAVTSRFATASGHCARTLAIGEAGCYVST